MSCSDPNHDLHAYALGELTAPQRRQIEAHLSACAGCREELATLRLTLEVLPALREEEIPRRIAFVSDKVFEPRWWQTLWNPTFASACVLAAAILVHAFARPAEVSQAQIDAAVMQAVAQVEDRLAYLDQRDRQLTQAFMTATGLVRQ
jgi:anti-sigma factor RsiW